MEKHVTIKGELLSKKEITMQKFKKFEITIQETEMTPMKDNAGHIIKDAKGKIEYQKDFYKYNITLFGDRFARIYDELQTRQDYIVICNLTSFSGKRKGTEEEYSILTLNCKSIDKIANLLDRVNDNYNKKLAEEQKKNKDEDDDYPEFLR